MTFDCAVLTVSEMIVMVLLGAAFACLAIPRIESMLESFHRYKVRRLEEQATDYRRMIWALVASVGGSVTIHKSAMMDADEHGIVRQDDPVTGAITFTLFPRRR